MRPSKAVLYSAMLCLVALPGLAEAQAVVRDIVFPVKGEFSYRNDFHEPRAGGAREHLGIDIIATKMTPIVAAVDGEVTFIPMTEPSWGYSITIKDAEGYSYRYLHINNDTPGTDDGAGGTQYAYAAGLVRGSPVTRGQVIGWVGDSGNAEAVESHLHFEIRLADRTAINPFDTLMAASGGRTGGTAAPFEHAPEVPLGVEEELVRELEMGATGADVKVLQTKLRELGYFTEEITGYFGSITRAAVIAFQKAKGINPIGIVGPLTRAALIASKYVFANELQEGMQGESVRQLQKALAKAGYFTSEVTGYFGPFTMAAVMAFQAKNGLEPLGVVGPQTRLALNQLP